jgi:tRNA threonylcarbamoyladenosine biosynthesis protein TsaB
LKRILALEASTGIGSVCLRSGNAALFEASFVAERAHTVQLFAAVQAAFRASGGAIDRIVVGLGPGSYAGVRIAIAAAIGLQGACSAELTGIPSVAALVIEGGNYFVIGDARRGTFYFTHVRDGICVEGPVLLDEARMHERLAAPANVRVMSSDCLPAFAEVQSAVPTARRLAELAAADTGIVQRGTLEPIYLREPHITKPRAETAAPS